MFQKYRHTFISEWRKRKTSELKQAFTVIIFMGYYFDQIDLSGNHAVNLSNALNIYIDNHGKQKLGPLFDSD